MDTTRADLGFADALDGFDPADWISKAPPAHPRAAKAETQTAANAAGFRSREPRPVMEAEANPPVRRRRTGRNVQFNVKARAETIAAFCAIADRQGWGLGETLEQAVALLERDYGTEMRG